MAEGHEKLANELEREAAELEEKGRALDKHVKEARTDWERKRSDAAVPGAVPPSDEEEAALGAGDDPKDSDGAADVPAAGP
ncbi:MAG: hypothetical protein QOH12_1140 [Solirubrobacteraceae bacterium]|jgi:hypothetical protein|nr:hypothetical protein [Solirubrobacteraceae bacterium]